MQAPKRVNILGVGVSAINMSMALDFMEWAIVKELQTYISVCPVSTILACLDDPAVRRAVNGAGLVTPDGMPIVWLARAAGHPHVSRVYGPDLMLYFCVRSVGPGYRHYFYGGTEGVPEQLATALITRFPGLQVTGGYSPPFRPLTSEEDAEVVGRINAARPDVVWVGLGSPKQDLWMATHRERLEASVLVGVGAAFDFYTGRVRQAPHWMMRISLEWLFRLFQEPRRLWRRYLLGNPRFVVNVILQRTGIRHFPLESSSPILSRRETTNAPER
jgi:N-acetylglucosaminyldiphosphoundecaprenol N-acetyl-beta-D-mannosaminyltransferase